MPVSSERFAAFLRALEKGVDTILVPDFRLHGKL